MNDIEKQYNEMLSMVEKRGYDGRGKGVDVYECKNGHRFYTRYKDKGVTPFCITCRECRQTATHKNTITEQMASNLGVEVHNWVRPTLSQTLDMSEGMIEHVLRGGLVLEEHIVDGIKKRMEEIAQKNPKTRIVIMAEDKSKEQIEVISKYAKAKGLEVVIETISDVESALEEQVKSHVEKIEEEVGSKELQQLQKVLMAKPPEVHALSETPTTRNRRERRAWERQQKKQQKMHRK